MKDTILGLALSGILGMSFAAASLHVLAGDDVLELPDSLPEAPQPTAEACQESRSLVAPRFDYEAHMIAQTVWGEARGCSKMEQAAVAWCILNRVDSPAFPSTIEGVVTQPHQFDGYRAEHPVDHDILNVVQDVLNQWRSGDDSRRVLPADYLFFDGDGRHNHFHKEWQSCEEWDWSLENPYKEEK